MVKNIINAQIGQTRIDRLGAKLVIRDTRSAPREPWSGSGRSGLDYDVVYEDGTSRWLADTVIDSFTTYVSGPLVHDQQLLTAMRIGAALKDAPPELDQAALKAALVTADCLSYGFDEPRSLCRTLTQVISAYVGALPKAS